MQKKIIVLVLLLVSIAAFVMPAMAARDMGEMADSLAEQSNSVGKVVVAISAVAGVICLLMGFLELKKAANRRGDGSVAKGIITIIVGFALASIVVISASGSKTIHGDEGAMSERINSFSN